MELWHSRLIAGMHCRNVAHAPVQQLSWLSLKAAMSPPIFQAQERIVCVSEGVERVGSQTVLIYGGLGATKLNPGGQHGPKGD